MCFTAVAFISTESIPVRYIGCEVVCGAGAGKNLLFGTREFGHLLSIESHRTTNLLSREYRVDVDELFIQK